MPSFRDLENQLSQGRFEDFIRSLRSVDLDYSSTNNLVKILEKNEQIKSYLKQIHIAVLSSFTINNIKEKLFLENIKQGFYPIIEFGGYDQYIIELLNKESFLYTSKFDFVILAIDTNSIFGTTDFEFFTKKREYLGSLLDEKFSHLNQALTYFKANGNGTLLLTNLIVPVDSPLGLYETKAEVGYYDLIRSYNGHLKNITAKSKAFYLVDIDSIASSIGKANITDNKYYFIGKLLFNNRMISVLSHHLATIIASSYGKTKKCLVLDLDNTIWGGVVGEVGPNNVRISNDGVGLIYKTTQRILLNLFNRGIILAVVSKNNYEDAIAPFKENKNMVLGLENVAVFKANWNEKHKNIRDIAKELNLGLDSFVFLDDNPAERILVKNLIPEVEVLDFPNDVADLPDMLRRLDIFDKIHFTNEDVSKSKMYVQDGQRKQFKSEFKDEKEYLKELNIEFYIDTINESNIERLAELTNKTNQFNLRTQRFTLAQMEGYSKDKNYHIYSCRSKDKFGDQGIIGVLMLKKENDYWFIVNYLLSCRVLGRGIEYEFLYACLKDIDSKILGEYLPTPKNSQVKDFYLNAGFEKESDKYAYLPGKTVLRRSKWTKWRYENE